MKHFWKGFESSKSSPPIRFKKYVILLYWEPEDKKSEKVKADFKKISSRYPTVAVKVVNIKKDPMKPIKHNVTSAPTILLLKDGREVERIKSEDGLTLLEQLFRKART